MPVESCELDGQPGFRWGDEGRCYTYTAGDEQSRDDAREKAARQGRAIKARGDETGEAGASVRELVQIQSTGAFRGGFPDVPIAAGVDLQAIRASDADPFFVTLPIIPEIGMVSENGLLYDDTLAESIETQINSKKPGSNFGHLAEQERDTAFPHPDAFWVGALRVADTLWAKAYVPPGAARTHLQQLKNVGGRIATSIFGSGLAERVSDGVERLVEFALEKIDFAPPERAALQYAAPVVVTSETKSKERQETMPTKQEIIETLQLADLPDKLRKAIIDEHERDTGQRRRISELEQSLSDAETARDRAVQELDRHQAEQRRVVFETVLEERVNELTNWQISSEANKAKVKALRETIAGTVRSKIGDSYDQTKLDTALSETAESLKPVIETMRDALSGPSAAVSARVRGERARFEDTPQARAEARRRTGIGI